MSLSAGTHSSLALSELPESNAGLRSPDPFAGFVMIASHGRNCHHCQLRQFIITVRRSRTHRSAYPEARHIKVDRSAFDFLA
jgi:hypothetical protein